MASRRLLTFVGLFLLLTGTSAGARQAPTLPASLSNAEYWNLVRDLSEPDGNFRSDNLVSNEVYFQSIIPELLTTTKTDRVYLGVGPEQNFTYIAALKPRMVFIVDIRRGNLHTQLMYKALFELSNDRAEFVSLLFSKKRPAGLTTKSSVQELFSAFVPVETSEVLYKENLQAIQDQLVKTRQLPLSPDDLKGIEWVYYHFYWYGPGLTYASSSGGSGRGNFVNFQSLMVADDGFGVARSFLATEDNFLYLKSLHTKNLLVPVVGNFAGAKAVRGIGAYLKARHAVVSAFYLSNVEQYLQQDGLWMTFCGNVAHLPLDASSTFIYSQNAGRGGGRGLSSYYRSMIKDVEAYKCDTGLAR